jgi:hypothetical protein
MDNILNLIESTIILPPLLKQSAHKIFNIIESNLFRPLSDDTIIDDLNKIFVEDLNDIKKMLEMYVERSITSSRLTKALDKGYLLLSMMNFQEKLMSNQTYMVKYPDLILNLFYNDIEYGNFDIKCKLVIIPKRFEIIWDGQDVGVIASYDSIDEIIKLDFSNVKFFKHNMLYVDNITAIESEVNEKVMNDINSEYDSNITFNIQYKEPKDISNMNNDSFSTTGVVGFSLESEFLQLTTQNFYSLYSTFNEEGKRNILLQVLLHEFTHFEDVISISKQKNISNYDSATVNANNYKLNTRDVEKANISYIQNSSELQVYASGVFHLMLSFLVAEYKKKNIKDKIQQTIRSIDEFCDYFIKYGNLSDTDRKTLTRYFDIKNTSKIKIPIVFQGVKKFKIVDGGKLWSKFRGYIIDNFLEVLPTIEDEYDSIKKMSQGNIETPKIRKEKDETINLKTGNKIKKVNAKTVISIRDRVLNYIYYTLNSYDNIEEFMQQMKDYYENTEDEGIIFKSTQRYSDLKGEITDYQLVFERNDKKSPFDYSLDKTNKIITVYLDNRINSRVYDMSETDFKDRYSETFKNLINTLAQIE